MTMATVQLPPWMTTLYPVGRLRGYRITRLEEQSMGLFSLDAATAAELGKENIGVLFGNCIGLERVVRRLRPLDIASEQATWVVISATCGMAASVYKLWHFPEGDEYVSPAKVPPYWRTQRLLFTTPEGLRDIGPAQIDGASIAGLLLLDLQFNVHMARGMESGNFYVQHDRPQFIVDFRARCAREDWSPPLLIFAKKPAKALNTDAAPSPYCLEALWFVNGETFCCAEADD